MCVCCIVGPCYSSMCFRFGLYYIYSFRKSTYVYIIISLSPSIDVYYVCVNVYMCMYV